MRLSPDFPCFWGYTELSSALYRCRIAPRGFFRYIKYKAALHRSDDWCCPVSRPVQDFIPVVTRPVLPGAPIWKSRVLNGKRKNTIWNITTTGASKWPASFCSFRSVTRCGKHIRNFCHVTGRRALWVRSPASKKEKTPGTLVPGVFEYFCKSLALAELGSAAGSLETVFFTCTTLNPLRCKGLRVQFAIYTAKLTSKSVPGNGLLFLICFDCQRTSILKSVCCYVPLSV